MIYEVTKEGEVFNKFGRKLKPMISRKGYLYYGIYENRIRTLKKSHRLVAEKYIPNPKDYPQVNHIDKNKTNNHVSNLEWCSCKKNVRHSAKLTQEFVDVIRAVIKEAPKVNMSAMARYYGVHKSTIHYIKKGVLWA